MFLKGMVQYDWNRGDTMRQDELWRIKLAAAIADFEDRIITDDVFRAVLYSYGFRGVRLQEEFLYHELRRHDIEQHKTLNGKLKIA